MTVNTFKVSKSTVKKDLIRFEDIFGVVEEIK